MEIDAVFKFYREEFGPAYVDLISYIVDKPQQISFELDAVLSHITQSYNLDINDTKKKENIEKAMGHLERAALDCYKLLWAETYRTIKRIENLGFYRKFCLNTPEHDFVAGVQKVRELARTARTKEIASMGIEPNASLDLYKEVVKESLKLAGSLDKHKIGEIQKLKGLTHLKIIILQNFIGFITGFASASLLWLLTR